MDISETVGILSKIKNISQGQPGSQNTNEKAPEIDSPALQAPEAPEDTRGHPEDVTEPQESDLLPRSIPRNLRHCRDYCGNRPDRWVETKKGRHCHGGRVKIVCKLCGKFIGYRFWNTGQPKAKRGKRR